MINYRLELKNTPSEYSNEDLDEIIKTKKEEVKSEIWKYILEFMELFKQETFNEVNKYINFLKKEIKHYPEH